MKSKFGMASFLKLLIICTLFLNPNSLLRSLSFRLRHLEKNINHYVTSQCDDHHSFPDLKRSIDKEFLNISMPAFFGLTTEPFLSIVEGILVARLGPAEQAGMGISTSAQYSVAKLYNDPLLKTTTSMVAGKSGNDLSVSVSTAIATAIFIGFTQCIIYILFASNILRWMSVSKVSDMYRPALTYLRWRALGVPAATVLIVTNGIFRGRGDTRTPLYYTTIGAAINLVLDYLLMFTFGMGISGTGLANSLSQWITVVPLLYLLNETIPFQLKGLNIPFFKKAVSSYLKAGGLIFLRTIAKISTYTVASSSAAKLGTIPMAAYTLTFSLGFTASQLCESLSIAAQALLARDMPLNSERKRLSAQHVIRRSLQSGLFVSLGLTIATLLNLNNILSQMTKSPDVRKVTLQVIPMVVLTQIFKGVSSSTGGILLGGLDWSCSTSGMIIASIFSIAAFHILPNSLTNIWWSLAIFTSTQVVAALVRIFSNTGPWRGLYTKQPQLMKESVIESFNDVSKTAELTFVAAKSLLSPKEDNSDAENVEAAK